ncbi:cache domain-containing sensor histidine kinase [Anaerotalea alkaliphila]|uniref:histidine kinase n=1 Tax=Anaerotalea alkaliphila TaxID=2662126 RepID=A0A7X5HWP8_9FIRM|nr:sensor histidine kinase [Anaerotalea alkaliphila]NDL68053.1 HAMP domain-containing protein [Anaerotalea alkaliphila]
MLARLKNQYGNLRIRNKMMVNFLLVVILTVFALSYLNMNILRSSLMDVTNEHTYQMVEQVNVRIDSYVSGMNKTIDLLVENADVRAYINRKEESSEDLELEKAVLESLNLYTRNDSNIIGMLIASEDGGIISATMEKIEENPVTEELWYMQTIENPKGIHLFSQPIGRNVRSRFSNYNADNVVSLSKAIFNRQGEVAGVALIDMKLSAIESIIDSVVLGKSGFLFILQDNGQTVYAPVNPLVYRIRMEEAVQDRIVEIGSEEYQILSIRSGYTGWNMVGVFPTGETLQVIVQVISSFVLYGLIIFAIAIFLSHYLTSSLTKPISTLGALMERAEEGQLDQVFVSSYTDEISQLGHRFNKMLESIQNLLQMVYVEQKEKREAELRAFQAQINPHFLYNTLDTINWMAIEHGADDIAEMVTALTDLFRIGLSKGNEIIPLENEIKHVESYLKIQRVRYEAMIQYEIICSRQLKRLRVIKLIIQPIVENAIYHGIKTNDRPGEIRIEVDIREGWLLISVSDNGAGIPAEKVAQLNAMLCGELERADAFGIGLFNVNERLRLNFGNEFGVEVDSVEGEGTRVFIRHPILLDEQEVRDA